MVTFGAPNRAICTIRRPRTNTPLQALVTLNDPVFVEAAQALARRIVERDGRLDHGRPTACRLAGRLDRGGAGRRAARGPGGHSVQVAPTP